MGKKIDSSSLEPMVGTFYPSPFDEPCLARERKRLGDAAGLTQFGVNLLRLPPGAWSSQRHWQTESDEFVYVLSGEVTLVTDSGPELLRAGDAAGFKAGEPDGHCLQNRSDADALILEIGTRLPDDAAHYSDIDMYAPPGDQPAMYTRRDGTPYDDIRRRAKPAAR
ncbi:MAG TPA: cupin domain-containing protein [Acetobacteraceae bacterium]|nr:cupin domain-containing protein [Acetobacteraceae bacterium]